MTVELEQAIENRIVKYVEGKGGLALKLVLASERGMPDRTLLLPGGIVIFSETKRPKDAKTYHQQLVWQARLQKRGFRCEFVTSMEEVAKIVKEEEEKKRNQEVWKDVVGFEGSYQVSSIGRVRSIDRVCSDGKKCKGKILRQNLDGVGYPNVTLSKCGKTKTQNVHKLLLEAHVGPRPPKHVARHLDGCQTNNTTTNLVWGTNSENILDQVRHGTKHHRKVRRGDGVEFNSVKEAAESSGIKHPTKITSVCRGRNKTAGGFTWSYVQ